MPLLLAFLCLATLSPPVQAMDSTSTVTPINKVVQMLQSMLAKGKAEKHSEEVVFASFQQWCDGVRADTSKAIDEAGSKITQLAADIDKAEADAEALGAEAADLQASVAAMEVELANATAVRKKEEADYKVAHQDYSESIDAIERAVIVLKQRARDVPQSLAQVAASKLVRDVDRRAIESFLALGSAAASAAGAPEANAYEFQSGGIVTILEKLKAKFIDERHALEKAEMNARANYELLAQQLTDSIKRSEGQATEKTSAKAGRLQDAAIAKEDMGSTEAGKAEDEKALSDADATCKAKSQEFEKNQVTRAAEVEAIAKAIGILTSDAVAGTADRHLQRETTDATLAASAPSLAQLRSTEVDSPERRSKAAKLLRAKAAALHSRYLALAATHAEDDPFSKVKKMIKDLIVKLMEEANEEADHKGYCDAELATNKQTRENKAAEVESLSAQVEKRTADSAQLADEIQGLSDQIAEARLKMAQATELRGKEAENHAAVAAEAKDAQKAVEEAIRILKDFYSGGSLLQEHHKGKPGKAAAKPGKAAAMLQRGQRGKAAGKKAVQTSREPYTGLSNEATGVIGMLEVILSDFARLETGTLAEEEVSKDAHAKFMAESEEDVAVKGTELKHKESAKAQNDEALSDLKKELSLTADELDKATAYYEKLKPMCVDTGLSYEDRVASRKEEIVSLQEALRILEGEDLA